MRKFLIDEGGWMLVIIALLFGCLAVSLVDIAEVQRKGPEAVVVGQSEKGKTPTSYKMAVRLDDGTVKVVLARDQDYYTVKPGTRVSLQVHKSLVFGHERGLTMEVLP